MSTQMRVAQEESGWAVLNGDRHVAINGEVHHVRREDLIAEIEGRGLFVWQDGSISKQKEEPVVVAHDLPDGGFLPPAEDVSENDQPTYTPPTPGPTEDPPTDPGADPEDPDPNPTVPVKPDSTEEKPKAKRYRAKKKPEGAPRFNEEQKKARAEYAKKYRAQMTDEQKEKARAAARERQRKWREAHPDKAAEFAKRSSERRRERYNEDPEFRQEYRSKQKAYAKAKS